MNISAKELAKLINVSPATVSMVFNNKPGISDATRELVLKPQPSMAMRRKNESSGASSRIIQLVNYKSTEGCCRHTVFLPADRRNLHQIPARVCCASYLLFL